MKNERRGPGTREAAHAGEPIVPALGVQPRGDRQDGGGEVGGVRRATLLVGHDAQPRHPLRRAEHSAHEVLSGRGVHPRRAQHDRAGAGLQHCPFAGELARAIDAGRGRGIALDVRRALQPVEHVVRRDMDQRNAAISAQPREQRRAVAVGAIGCLGIGLRSIDRGIGGGVHYQRRRRCAERRLDRFGAVEVEFGAADTVYERPPPLPLPPTPSRKGSGCLNGQA